MKKSVLGIIFSSNREQILTIKRRDVPVWVLPGGGLEDDEDPEDAIIREVFEETGLHVKVKRNVCSYLPINRLGTHTHLFECEVINGKPTTGSETADIGYFPIDKLPRPFFYIHKDMFMDALNENSEYQEKTLSQVTYPALIRFFFKHPILLVRFLLSQLGYPINS